jgi:hypothetical protein
MKVISSMLLGMSLALASASISAAQDPASAPPKVIQLTREWIKPGKSGMAHDRSEAAFVSLMNKAKLEGHYVALNSMSGKSRALYITRYPSFEAWEKDNRIIEKNPAFSAENDRAATTDGELLDGLDQAVFTYDEDLSYHPHPDTSHARYYELTVFQVRPGHHKDWVDVTKLYTDALTKAGSSAHWATYEVAYGAEGGTFLSITARKSLTEVDDELGAFKKVLDAAGGEEGFNKIDELFGKAVESSRSELFSINPKQSYAEEAWIKGDPDFWKPKSKVPEAAGAKPATAAPKPSSR